MADTINVGVLRALLTADTAQFTAGLTDADRALKKFESETKKFASQMGKIGANMTTLGTQATAAFTLPIVAGFGAASKAAIDFESSFAGVRKTVDASEAEFAVLEQQFRGLSKEIPVTVHELNRLGESAGALGIPKESILEFAEVMAKLGVTTNVTSEQAAESIAKIQNIFGAAGKSTEEFASTLVDLGNKGASTEQEILALATRMASAGNTFGMTQAQVLGFASAIANVGMEAEAGGSAFSRVVIDMSKDLEGFAKVAGMSAEAFGKLFKQDAAAAFQAFVEGLGRIKQSGGDLSATLEDLGIKELRQADLLRRLAGASDMVGQSLQTANQAWRENSALSEEAQKRFETTQSSLTLLWNRLTDVAITFGTALKPAIDSAIGALDAFLPVLQSMAEMFAALPGPIQLVIVGIAGIAAAIGPVMLVVGQFALGLQALAGLGGVAGLAASLSTMATVISTTFTAAVGALVTLFTVTLPAAVGPLIVFFTTTLPAAFTATIAFLGPQGLIAVALLALAAIWYKWGDQIKDIVSKVYTAVKTWLVDKLAAIWDTVKQKIEAVKGYFKDLYTAVVGQSYIPDMVEGIGRSIAQLDNVFVKPSQLANQLVGAAFQEMTKVATRALTDLLQKVTGHFTDITDTVIPSFASRGIGRMSEAGTGFKDAFLGSFGAGLAQGLVQLAGAGLGALVNHFQGGEEAKVVNPIRDAFFAMFGGYEGLAAQLTAASDGNIADQLLKTLFNADTKVAFDAAKEAIEAVLAGAGQAVQDSPAQAAMESLGVSVEGLATQLTALHEQITTWQAAFTASITALASSVTDVLQAAWVGFVTQFQESVALMAALIMDPLTLQWTTWVQTFTDTSYAVIGLIQDALIPQVQAFIGALDAIPRSIDVSINVSRSEMPDMSVDAVPSFANEGIVSKPMFAVVGDAPEPEWILHESSVQALVNRGAAMGAALWQSASGGTSTSDLAGGGRSGGDSFSLQLSPGAIVVHQQPGEDPVAFARRLVTAIPDALRYDHSLVRKIRGATA